MRMHKNGQTARYRGKHLKQKTFASSGIKKPVAFMLALIMIFGCTATGFAVSYQGGTPKEEVVYINLNTDGSVDEICVVNSFDLDEAGRIIDYGDYTELRNMTTSDEITFEDEKVTIDANKGKMYYEGRLDRKCIPWNIKIKYYIDGKEYKAEDAVGKSGECRIDISVDKNRECRGNFFEKYAIQTTLTFDTEKFSNIRSKGATIANVGNKKQLNFIIIPDTPTDISITADTDDFELEQIAMNGIKMDMDINVDVMKNQDFRDSINEIKDAAKDFDEGATDLLDGTGEMKDGADDLVEGVEKLKTDGVDVLSDGAFELASGAATLYDGTCDLYKGTRTLRKGMSEAVSGAEALDKGLNKLKGKNAELTAATGTIFDTILGSVSAQITAQLPPGSPTVTLTKTNYESTIFHLIAGGVYQAMPAASRAAIWAAAETTAADEVRASIKGDPSIMAAIEAGVGAQVNLAAGGLDVWSSMTDEEKAPYIAKGVEAQVTAKLKDTAFQKTVIEKAIAESVKNDPSQIAGDPQAAALLKAYKELKSVDAYYHGILDYTGGVAIAAGGAKALYDGLIKADDGVLELKDGAYELRDGALKLKDGTDELTDGVVDLEDGVLELLDGAIEMRDGTIELHDGVIELKDGTIEFKDKTSDIEVTIADKIEKAVKDMFGGNIKVQSFVSDRNNNVKSVQFVMQVKPVKSEKEEAEVIVEEHDDSGVVAKFLRLFGIDKK